jgi:biopolymer transport protein ExbD
MSRRRPPTFEDKKPDMTSMIDVTFLLLIFFIVTLNFHTLEGRLDAALPKTHGIRQFDTPPIEPIVLTLQVANPGTLQVDPDSKRHKVFAGRVMRYKIGTRVFADLAKVQEFLNTLDRESTVTLDPMAGTVQGDVIKALDVVLDVGFEHVDFAGSREDS